MRDWLWGLLIVGFVILGVTAWAPATSPPEAAPPGACDRIVGYGVIPPSFSNERYQECLHAAALRAPASTRRPAGLVAETAF